MKKLFLLYLFVAVLIGGAAVAAHADVIEDFEGPFQATPSHGTVPEDWVTDGSTSIQFSQTSDAYEGNHALQATGTYDDGWTWVSDQILPTYVGREYTTTPGTTFTVTCRVKADVTPFFDECVAVIGVGLIEYNPSTGSWVQREEGRRRYLYEDIADYELITAELTTRSGRFLLGFGFVVTENGGTATFYVDNFTCDVELTPAQFQVLEDGAVRDSETGLIWLQDADAFGAMTWDEAKSAAASLDGDWRLPTKSELQGLGTSPQVTWEHGYPSATWTIPEEPFLSMRNNYLYWSNTPHCATGEIWCLSIGDGYTYTIPAEDYAHVWLVRGVSADSDACDDGEESDDGGTTAPAPASKGHSGCFINSLIP